MTKKKLLLHTCCAPCITVPHEKLNSCYEIKSFFYNPNIHPIEEYLRRLQELKALAKKLNIEVISPDYDPDYWFERIRGFEHEPEGGRRCAICFQIRLEQTATLAKRDGFDAFTTTLTISPHKNTMLINQIGFEISQQHQILFLEENFKKKDGYKRSIELSTRYNLYRQNYCGCVFSRR